MAATTRALAPATTPPGSPVLAVRPRRRLDRQARAGLLFTLPAITFFAVFVLGPTVAVVVLGFTSYDLLTPPEFSGVDNFVRMASDRRLHEVFGNTFFYVVAAVVLINVIALALAVQLNRRIPTRLRLILRSAYFFPSLVALVYVSIIWQFLLQADTGVVNYYITSFGGPRINWLGGQTMGVVSVVLVDVWRNVGFAFLIFLAALQDIPSERLEAAAVDGARKWRTFWHVQLPAISPAVFFSLVLTMIQAWRIFESIIVLTGGGPGDSTRSITMYLYEMAFQSFDMGYASAIAVALFAVVMALTLLFLGFQRRWVHYE
jgi:multiple sugar transport system permease protein